MLGSDHGRLDTAELGTVGISDGVGGAVGCRLPDVGVGAGADVGAVVAVAVEGLGLVVVSPVDRVGTGESPEVDGEGDAVVVASSVAVGEPLGRPAALGSGDPPVAGSNDDPRFSM